MTSPDTYQNLADQGCSQAEAARILGVTRQAVFYAAKRYGIKFRKEWIEVPTVIDGFEYPSRSAAARAIGVSESTLRF